MPDALSQPSSPTALWNDVAVSLSWTPYQEYGDLAILRDSDGSMTSLIRRVSDLLDDAGLWSSGFQLGDWLDPDAPASNLAAAKTHPHLVATAFLCKTTREMAATAELLGQEEDAADFSALAARVLAAFRREYITALGRLVNASATAYVLANAFGTLFDEQLRKAGDRLADIVAKRGYRISTGFAGTRLVAEALSSTDHSDTAHSLVLEEAGLSFLYSVTMGDHDMGALGLRSSGRYRKRQRHDIARPSRARRRRRLASSRGRRVAAPRTRLLPVRIAPQLKSPWTRRSARWLRMQPSGRRFRTCHNAISRSASGRVSAGSGRHVAERRASAHAWGIGRARE
ncbi:hypothetical protein [Microbacterium oryzae]|uniref:alpha-L-rhamnosidase-related protein n=1 Tax=Microbacterium oryzae TaxID=743009 RepID=UPI003CCDCA1B